MGASVGEVFYRPQEVGSDTQNFCASTVRSSYSPAVRPAGESLLCATFNPPLNVTHEIRAPRSVRLAGLKHVTRGEAWMTQRTSSTLHREAGVCACRIQRKSTGAPVKRSQLQQGGAAFFRRAATTGGNECAPEL